MLKVMNFSWSVLLMRLTERNWTSNFWTCPENASHWRTAASIRWLAPLRYARYPAWWRPFEVSDESWIQGASSFSLSTGFRLILQCGGGRSGRSLFFSGHSMAATLPETFHLSSGRADSRSRRWTQHTLPHSPSLRRIAFGASHARNPD